MAKEITVALYGYKLIDNEWSTSFDTRNLKAFVATLHQELEPLGIRVTCVEELDNVLEVRGYGDLLNIVRIRSPRDHIGNLCLGHIIGQSEHCDLLEDIRRGVSRVAFAPEMVEPEGSNKVVCHNCGCGC